MNNLVIIDEVGKAIVNGATVSVIYKESKSIIFYDRETYRIHTVNFDSEEVTDKEFKGIANAIRLNKTIYEIKGEIE